MSTEQWRIGVKNLLSESSFSTGNPVAKVDNDSESQVPSADVSNLAISPMFNMGARRNSVQQHKEKFENLPEDLRVTEACSLPPQLHRERERHWHGRRQRQRWCLAQQVLFLQGAPRCCFASSLVATRNIKTRSQVSDPQSQRRDV